jgi:hypothetical protein
MVAPFVLVGYVTPLHSLHDFWIRYRAFGNDYEQLPISDLPDICDLPWADFLAKFCERVQTNQCEGFIDAADFDELRAVQYLMIYDNFYIQLHHEGALRGTGLDGADDKLLKFLVQSMFNDFNSFDTRSQDQLLKLRQKLLRYVIGHVVLYPFIISFFLVKLLVKNVAQLRSNPAEFLAREWGGNSRWVFRLYNEVDHITAARLAEGLTIANGALAKASQPPEMYRLVQRLSSTIVLGVLLLSFINSYLLTMAAVGGRTLFWWLSAGLIGYSATSRESPARREYNHLSDLDRLTRALHYDRPEWYRSASRFTEIITWDFLHTRMYGLVAAVARTLLMPLLLLQVYTDQSLPRLIEFMDRHSTVVDGVGAMAAPASFGVELVNSTEHTSAAPAAAAAAQGDLATEALSGQPSFEYKRERSLASFAAIYEQWFARNRDAVASAIVSVPTLNNGATGGQQASAAAAMHAAATFTTAHDREQIMVSQVDSSWILLRREFVTMPSERSFIPSGGYGSVDRDMQPPHS